MISASFLGGIIYEKVPAVICYVIALLKLSFISDDWIFYISNAYSFSSILYTHIDPFIRIKNIISKFMQ